MAEQALPIFEPKPGVVYKYKYKEIFKNIANGKLNEKETYKTLILTDLWFVVYFILGMPNANHQFIVNCCREVEDGPVDATLDIWGREHLKSVRRNTVVTMLDGTSKTLDDVHAGDVIVGFDDNWKTARSNVLAKTDLYTTDAIEITTRSGKCISVGLEHRLLGIEGFIEAQKLKIGDYVGIPRRISITAQASINADEARFLGYMAGDGGCSGNSCVFTNMDTSVLDDFYRVCDVIGFKHNTRATKSKAFDVNISSHTKAPREFLRAHDMKHLSIHKRVPKSVLKSKNKVVAEFLAGLFDSDGSVSTRSNQVILTLGNKELVLDIRNLLLRFGIVANYFEAENGHNGAYTIYISSKESLRKFRDSIPIVCDHKKKNLDEAISSISDRRGKGDLIPIGWTSMLSGTPRQRKFRNGGAHRLSGKATSRDKVLKYAEIDNNDKLKVLCESDVAWDEIVKIGKPISTECYDIQVDNQQVFIGNGIISHNSSIITIAETIQLILKYPEKTHCLFSYVKPIAKKFLFSIKETLSKNKALIKLFPDVLYENPEKEAQIWSMDEGIIVKRNTNRKEPTLCASGLTEGMVTGMHFEYRKYDDIVTEDIGQSFDVMEDVKLKFDSSQNLGIDGGSHRVVGTFYHYEDPLVYIKKKMSIADPTKPAYHLRLKPATEDGTASGKPVFLSQARLDGLKLTKTFKVQQLLNPAPEGSKKLNKNFVKIVKHVDLPRVLHKIQIIDPAGKKGTGDPWASVVVGVSPDARDIRASSLYIVDLALFQMQHTQTINAIVQMYKNNGRVLKVGIEQVGQSTAEVHISSELKNLGVSVNEENGRLVIFTPSGRNKEHRIDQGLSWHLDNGKIFVSDAIERKFIDAFLAEIDNFPYSNSDHIIDTLSYFILDLLPKCRFRSEEQVVTIVDVPFGAYT